MVSRSVISLSLDARWPSFHVCRQQTCLTPVFLAYVEQSDPMDALDEKLAGPPVMEIDEPVSVHDRKSLFVLHPKAVHL